MAAVGEAWQNGYAERLMRTIQEERAEIPKILKAIATLGRPDLIPEANTGYSTVWLIYYCIHVLLR